ncbi:hypothetical protein [Sphingomonas melonis]|uniref:hypothetical protein n=1 Tax=Sphingomonas melonis TaxID=152682 RepID=UPI0003A7D94E|nr:hypothetical protein [Sphingomonas melonis]
MSSCRSRASLYNAREIEFLRSVANVRHLGNLTRAQREWLEALAIREQINFDAIATAALAVLPSLCARWLSDGREQGREWVARNPTRDDGKPGSFRINLASGKWADFAVPDARGGDAISLAAYLFHNNDQLAAATDLKRMLGA